MVERSVYRSQETDTAIKEISLDPFESPYRPGPATAKSTAADTSPSESTGAAASITFPIDLRQSIQDHETSLIKAALKACQFNQKKTADALGVTYHQLRGYLKKYDLLGK